MMNCVRWCLMIFTISLWLPEDEAAKQPPNIVIMLMDDMGWGDLGVNGEPHLETPNIDQMAREGMTATSMYTSAPLCSPSRAALLTGRLPIRNGFYSNNLQGRNAYTPQDIVGGIADSEILLSEVLSEVGYASGIIGKWHLGHRSPHLPLERGFDYWFGSPNCHFGPYDDKETPNLPVFQNASMIGRYYEQFPIDKKSGVSNMTRLFTEEAVSFIHRKAENGGPFFFYWAPDATHAFTYASEEFRGTSRRGGNNGPFLCGKQTTFEGGMRAPGIFWWPGTIQPGSVTQQIWSQMDLFSTAIELAGGKPPTDRVIDGLPLGNSLLHPELEITRPMFFYRGDLLMAVRQGAYKMHLWTWSTPPHELEHGINYCPGFEVPNVTTSNQTDHSDIPVLFNIDRDPTERYPVDPYSAEYGHHIPTLLGVVIQHRSKLIKGEPQLNWCDRAVMHWAPPGCEALGQCLPVPPSKPTLCYWPH